MERLKGEGCQRLCELEEVNRPLKHKELKVALLWQWLHALKVRCIDPSLLALHQILCNMQ